MTKTRLKKFETYLRHHGCEILPVTNEHEAIRFRGKQVGVLYKSGGVSGSYVTEALIAFDKGLNWTGGPVSTGRRSNYKKEKAKLLERDGDNCFYCGKSLGDDITLEHLINLSAGGINTLANMVLAHEQCNFDTKTMTLAEKVNFAIKNRCVEVHEQESGIDKSFIYEVEK